MLASILWLIVTPPTPRVSDPQCRACVHTSMRTESGFCAVASLQCLLLCCPTVRPRTNSGAATSKYKTFPSRSSADQQSSSTRFFLRRCQPLRNFLRLTPLTPSSHLGESSRESPSPGSTPRLARSLSKFSLAVSAERLCLPLSLVPYHSLTANGPGMRFAQVKSCRCPSLASPDMRSLAMSSPSPVMRGCGGSASASALAIMAATAPLVSAVAQATT